ncbi:DoxX family protein [Blastochloris sulfoviridis]|uniref:DoxX family protein n=1 Tax=Blastochloris sulfoviridis TaxID=50712 RepID=UPI003CCC884C
MVSVPSPASAPLRLVRRAVSLLDRIPHAVVGLCARLFPAAVFWQSGQTKVDGFALSDSAVVLFREDYKLPFVDPLIAAHAAAIAEHLFPALLVVGLASRASALALLVMTAVIQIFVYPGAWPTHGVWATCLLVVLARGPGLVSLDHLIARRFVGR